MRLCYVADKRAYFTDRPLEEVWGDDWDDAPYEHNAGEPYAHQGPIYTIAYDSQLETPGEHAAALSVQQINRGAAPWLCDYWGSTGIAIHAGATLEEFTRAIRGAGGTVYTPHLGSFEDSWQHGYDCGYRAGFRAATSR